MIRTNHLPLTLSKYSPLIPIQSSLTLSTSVQSHSPHTHLNKNPPFNHEGMSTASAVLAPSAAVVACPGRSPSQRRERSVVYIGGMNSFGGLKANNSIASLGLPVCTNQSFAMVLSSLKSAAPQGKGRGGGALSSTCSAVSEIFKIAAIMNGLVLIGVAVGFVLLRVEATLEESE